MCCETAAPGDVEEVVDHIHALNHGPRRLAELPVSVGLVREIHEVLLTGVRGSRLIPGELRRSQNWIGPRGSTPFTRQARHRCFRYDASIRLFDEEADANG
jgi:hypothetical protein